MAKSKELPTELMCKYYSKAVDRCIAETPLFCYCGRIAYGLHIMHCKKFAAKVKSKCTELAKAAGEEW